MQLQKPFTIASDFALGVWLWPGFAFWPAGGWGLARGFVAFFDSSSYSTWASSSCFRSASPVLAHTFLSKIFINPPIKTIHTHA
jgi:hypothetical protein